MLLGAAGWGCGRRGEQNSSCGAEGADHHDHHHHPPAQEILDAWLQCQQGWLYLEPIFGSEDIMQQMPNEGRKFRAVDASWRRVMERLAKAPEVLTVCR